MVLQKLKQKKLIETEKVIEIGVKIFIASLKFREI